MAEFYVFDTEIEATACSNAINDSGWFPIGKTIAWCDAPRELKNGKWSVPRIPEKRLDNANVPQANRDAFLSVYGQDIQTLINSDFVVIEEEEI